MIRVVLFARADDDWRLERQAQWMAHVRRQPEAAGWTKHHFDIEEDAYTTCLLEWPAREAGRSLDAARACLDEFGAVEVRPSR